MTSLRYLFTLMCLFSPVLSLTAQQTTRSPRLQLIPGVQYQTVSRFTGSLQVILEKSVRKYDEASLAHGLSIGLDAGTGGGKVLAGWANTGGIGGGSLSIGLLQTWNKPGRVAAGQTFFGPELRGYFSALGYGVGYYWRIHGAQPGRTHTFDLSFGVWLRF